MKYIILSLSFLLLVVGCSQKKRIKIHVRFYIDSAVEICRGRDINGDSFITKIVVPIHDTVYIADTWHWEGYRFSPPKENQVSSISIDSSTNDDAITYWYDTTTLKLQRESNKRMKQLNKSIDTTRRLIENLKK